MNFFEHQDRARKQTTYTIILFIMAVVGTIAAIYFVLASVLYFGNPPVEPGSGVDGYNTPMFSWWQADLFFLVTGITTTVIFFGSLYKTRQLKGGGSAVARMLGGVPVQPNSGNSGERKLLNIVEEMALASGTPVPAVFVLEGDAINAFAAGFTPTDAAIGVTRGAIEKLTRDELQGVIAHEFSHILHGDMRINIRLMGVLHGILVLGLLGYFVMRIGFASGRGSRDGAAVALGLGAVGLCIWIIGYIGLLFGSLIKASVSRQREYLADASAVQYTRNPDGIAGALKKIGGFKDGSKVESKHAQEASHMFFGSILSKGFMSGMTSTHPPLVKRIKRILPNFDGEFSPVAEGFYADDDSPVSALAGTPAAARTPQQAPASIDQLQQALASKRARTTAKPKPAAPKQHLANPQQEISTGVSQLTDQIGKPTAEHLAYATQLMAAIPPQLTTASRHTLGAMAVVFGLLLDRNDANVRQAQLTQVQQNSEPMVAQELQRLAPILDQLNPVLRLPLIDLAIPALRQLSAEQYSRFSMNVNVLMHADQQIDLFEFTLHKILFRHLQADHIAPVPLTTQFYSINAVINESATVLAALAAWGHTDPAEAARAYQTAIIPLAPGRTPPPMPDASRYTLQDFDRALSAITQAVPVVKQQVLTACNVCIAYDGKITITEAELFRAVADALDCPSPPVLATAIS